MTVNVASITLEHCVREIEREGMRSIDKRATVSEEGGMKGNEEEKE